MNEREYISFKEHFSKLENVVIRCEMQIDAPMNSNLQDFTEFMNCVNRVKQYTYNVIGSFLKDDNYNSDFTKIAIHDIRHIAELNYLYFNKTRLFGHDDDLSYLLTTTINDEDFICDLIFTVSQ